MLDLPSKDTVWSSLREEYLEYAVLGELCREFWRRDLPVDILRSHTDQSGFDIVMETGSLQRHVQLKSSFVGSTTRTQKVNQKLQEKAGGCVVWVLFDRLTLAMDHFRWFGDRNPRAAMPPLGDRVAKHTKGNSQGVKAERPIIRTLAWGRFDRVETPAKLASLLFPDEFLASGKAEIR
jgi:hypothetical protein